LQSQAHERDLQVHGPIMPEEHHTAGTAGKRGLKEKLFHPFNHKASEKVEEIQSKLASSSLEKPMIKIVHAKHKAGKFTNIFNANHRHDEEHEKETDHKRSRIAESHRFNSFAPEREGNMVKWYVDGRDYFWVRAVCV
jgi:phospholipase D1/2